MKKARCCLLKTSGRSFLTLQNPTPPKMDISERYSYNPILRWNPQVEDYFIKAYGADHFSRICEALTLPSCYSCIRVNTLKSTSDAVIEKLRAIIQNSESESSKKGTNLMKTDADFDNDMAQRLKETNVDLISDNDNKLGQRKNQSVVSALNECSPGRTISKCQVRGLEYVIFVRGSGPHSIDYDHAPDRPPKEVIVSRKCGEAVLRGAQVFIPGVMACSSHVEQGDVVAVSVAVERPGLDGGWSIGITRGTVIQGLPTDPCYHGRSGFYIGQGITKKSRAGIFRASQGIAVEMTNRIFNLPSFHDVLEGEIFLQNLPSIVTAHALDPRKGERILDMCAAPGGKTTAIAILMGDEGEVVAVDRSHNKVMDIQNLASEMGLKCITTYKLDALKAVRRLHDSSDVSILCFGKDNISVNVQSHDKLNQDQESSVIADKLNGDKTPEVDVSNERRFERTYTSKADIRKSMRRMRNGPGRNQCVGGRVENSIGFCPSSFDRVLLDAPCSALGLRPRLFAGEETIISLRHHAKYQRRMFDQAVQLVRSGGVIVYSTCTINPGENEALVRYALDTYTFLSLAPQSPRIGGAGLVGRCDFPDGYVEEWLRPGEEDFVQRFDPSSAADTIGFFIAKFFVGPKEA